jgi:hypothetical protein
VITLTPEALKLTRKGRRLGIELKWADSISCHHCINEFATGQYYSRVIDDPASDCHSSGALGQVDLLRGAQLLMTA